MIDLAVRFLDQQRDLIEEQKRTNERLDELIDVLKNQRVTREIIREIVEQKPTESIFPRGNTLENHFPALSKPVPLPSKMELAKQWLADHPEDLKLTGRELKDLRKPMGVEISHKTWNDAKKEIDA